MFAFNPTYISKAANTVRFVERLKFRVSRTERPRVVVGWSRWGTIQRGDTAGVNSADEGLSRSLKDRESECDRE